MIQGSKTLVYRRRAPEDQISWYSPSGTTAISAPRTRASSSTELTSTPSRATVVAASGTASAL
jgi:hypothetical protein